MKFCTKLWQIHADKANIDYQAGVKKYDPPGPSRVVSTAFRLSGLSVQHSGFQPLSGNLWAIWHFVKRGEALP